MAYKFVDVHANRWLDILENNKFRRIVRTSIYHIRNKLCTLALKSTFLLTFSLGFYRLFKVNFYFDVELFVKIQFQRLMKIACNFFFFFLYAGKWCYELDAKTRELECSSALFEIWRRNERDYGELLCITGVISCNFVYMCQTNANANVNAKSVSLDDIRRDFHAVWVRSFQHASQYDGTSLFR